MSDDDTIIICILLGLCAAAGSPKQIAEAAKLVHQRHPHLTADQCQRRAVKLLKKHDYFRDLAAVMDEDAA